jgi:transposase
MASFAPMMDAARFERVASKCKNWKERSLSVARFLVVEGGSSSEAAEKYMMSQQQANVIRARFMLKAEDLRIEEFMNREKPKLAISALDPFSSQMQTLRDKGYTIDQIVAYLKEAGISTSPTTVSNFLKGIRA